LEGGSEAPGTSRKIEEPIGLPISFHLGNTFDGFQSPDQDAAANAGNFGTDVEHEMIAIGKIDVGVAAAQKHRLIARGRPAKVMSGGIARRVGFGFHDAPSHAAGGKLANNDLADQESSQSDGSGREFPATKSANQ
jgi:hypothetical protein